MKINIETDARLSADVVKSSGVGSNEEAGDVALRRYPEIRYRRRILAYRGKLNWAGDLDSTRLD